MSLYPGQIAVVLDLTRPDQAADGGGTTALCRRTTEQDTGATHGVELFASYSGARRRRGWRDAHRNRRGVVLQGSVPEQQREQVRDYSMQHKYCAIRTICSSQPR